MLVRAALDPAEICLPFHRVLTWRAEQFRFRLAQALLVTVLVAMATGEATVIGWLAATFVTGAVDARLSRRLLADPDNRRLFGFTCASLVVSAATFASVGVVLLASNAHSRLAEAILVMCAVCLNIAVMARGSRVATMVLVGPAGAILSLSPFIAGLFGFPVPVTDRLFVALGGIAYIVFVMQLTRTLSAEGQALRRALRECEAANRAKSEFLTVMSHEIRTPLNGVLGMAQIMERDTLTPTQRERLGVIRDSGESLMGLLGDILDLSKIEAGKLELETASFDVEAVVRSAHAAFAGVAVRKGLAFDVVVAPGATGLYCGDAGRFRQIVCNLVSNAVKFTAQGRVEVRLSTSAGRLVCAVADTGVGIAPDRIGRLFQKFVQADSSTTREFGGSGLGLAISQELALAMGGEIRVDSTPGKGSTFTLRLPLASAAGCEAPPLAAIPPPPPVAEGAMRILAAEDNPVNQTVLATLLAQVGLTPVMVGNGAEAVAAWEGADWDLILMDIQMPVMDGPAATRRIREGEAATGRPRTPILALTANAMTHQAESYRAAGMDGVVAKPIDVAELLATIAQAVSAPEPEVV